MITNISTILILHQSCTQHCNPSHHPHLDHIIPQPNSKAFHRILKVKEDKMISQCTAQNSVKHIPLLEFASTGVWACVDRWGRSVVWQWGRAESSSQKKAVSRGGSWSLRDVGTCCFSTAQFWKHVLHNMFQCVTIRVAESGCTPAYEWRFKCWCVESQLWYRTPKVLYTTLLMLVSSYVESSNIGSSWAIKWISGIGLVCHDNHNNNFGIW